MLQRLSIVFRAKFFLLMLKLPGFIIRPFGFGVRQVEGQAVSDKLRWLLRLLVLEPVDTPHESKRAIYEYLGGTSVAGKKHDVDIKDFEVPAAHPVPIRIYRPKGTQGPLPTLFWIHGGGWVLGSIASHDVFCRRLCKEANVAVVACDYRLAPEHPFPAAQEDVTAVWNWIRTHANEQDFDPDRLSMGGDSAGGTLTAILCQQLPVAERPAFQILCYLGGDYSKSTPSREKWGKGYLLDIELINWFFDRYCPGEDLTNPLISPLLIPKLENQPPAMVITAGMDPHADEGRQFVKRFEEVGVPVDHYHVAPMIHGFIALYGALPVADTAVGEFIQRIKGHLQG